MNTTENNKLIASFMGAEPIKSYDPEGWWKVPNGNLPHGYDTVMLGGMKYDSSFDWLMEVVEKIEQDLGEEFRVVIFEEDCTIYQKTLDGITLERYTLLIQIECEGYKIEATYKAVIEFIKWYNQQNK